MQYEMHYKIIEYLIGPTIQSKAINTIEYVQAISEYEPAIHILQQMENADNLLRKHTGTSVKYILISNEPRFKPPTYEDL